MLHTTSVDRAVRFLPLLLLAGCSSFPSLGPIHAAPPDPDPLPGRLAKVSETKTGDLTRTVLQDFEAVEDKQQTEVWCWAACASMILRFDLEELTPEALEATSQRAIAERIQGFDDEGKLKVQTAKYYEVLRALAPDAPASPFEAVWEAIKEDLSEAADKAERELLGDDENGGDGDGDVEVDPTIDFNDTQALRTALDRLFPPKGVPLKQLQIGDPAVVAMLEEPESVEGHAYVLVGATWEELTTLERIRGFVADRFPSELMDRFAPGAYRIKQVELVDPWEKDDESTPDVNEARVTVDYADFKQRVIFVTTRQNAIETLTEWSRLAELEVVK